MENQSSKMRTSTPQEAGSSMATPVSSPYTQTSSYDGNETFDVRSVIERLRSSPSATSEEEYVAPTAEDTQEEDGYDIGSLIRSLRPSTGLRDALPSVTESVSTGAEEEYYASDEGMKGHIVATIRPEEIEDIAAKYGVEEAPLRGYLDWVGGTIYGEDMDVTTQAGSLLQESLLLGLPGWLRKKFEDDDTEKAMDEVRDLVRSRQGIARTALDIGTGVAAAVLTGGGTALLKVGASAVSKTAAAKIAQSTAKSVVAKNAAETSLTAILTTTAKQGAIYGGLSGLAESESDSEFSGIAKGAALGVAAGMALQGIVRGGTATYKHITANRKKVEQEVADALAPVQDDILDAHVQMYGDVESKIVDAMQTPYVILPDEALDAMAIRLKRMGKIDETAPLKKAGEASAKDRRYVVGRSNPKAFDREKFTDNQVQSAYDELVRKDTEYVEMMLERSAARMEIESLQKETLSLIDYKLGNLKGEELTAEWNRRLAINKKVVASDFVRTLQGRAFQAVDYVSAAAPKSAASKLSREAIRMFDGNESAALLTEESGLPFDRIVNAIARGESEADVLAVTSSNVGLELVQKIAKEHGLNGEQINEYLAKYSKLKPKEQRKVKHLRKWYNDTLDRVNDLGLAIEKKEDYVTSMAKTFKDAHYDFLQREKTLKNQGVKSITEIDNIDDFVKYASIKEGRDNLSALGYMHDVKILPKKPKNPDELDDAWVVEAIDQFDALLNIRKDVQAFAKGNDAGGKLTGKLMSASELKREGHIPESLIEKDITKIIPRYTKSVFRSAVMQDPIADLRMNLNLLRKKDIVSKEAGGITYEKDIHNLEQMANYVLGGIPDTSAAAVTHQMATKSKAKANEFAAKISDNHPVIAELMRTAADGVHMMSGMVNMAYSAFLGSTLVAPTKNLSSIFTMTLPEVGFTFGTKHARSIFKRVHTTMMGDTLVIKNKALAAELGKKLGETVTDIPLMKRRIYFLENEGIPTGTLTTKMFEDINGELQAGLGKLGAAKKKTEELAMLPFKISELYMRSVAASAGEELAEAFIKNEQETRTFLSRMSKGYADKSQYLRRKYMQAARDMGEESQEALEIKDAIKQEFQRYLVDKSALSYSRAASGGFARSAGKFASMFTKWPTAVGARVAANIERKGFSKGMAENWHVFAIPMLVMAGADKILEELAGENVKKGLVGSGGLTSAAPILSPVPFIFEGQSFRPPIASPAFEAIKNKDPSKLLDYQPMMVPGYSFFRFLLSDLPLLLGQEPAIKSRNRAITGMFEDDGDVAKF